jgi:hypothetical protein
MEFEGDGPAPRPPVVPEPVTAQNMHVTPENVVELAAMFRDCAEMLAPATKHIEYDLRLDPDRPWMDDPVSKWALAQFNVYFVDGEHAFAKIVQAEYDQHVAMMEALVATARDYGLTDELMAAGFSEVAPR